MSFPGKHNTAGIPLVQLPSGEYQPLKGTLAGAAIVSAAVPAPIVLTEFSGAALPVSVLTLLLTFTDYSLYRAILFTVVNLDLTSVVTALLETSEDGVHPDDGFDQLITLEVNPGMQRSWQVGGDKLRKFYRLSAHTLSPGYPAATVKFRVSGVLW